MTTHSSATAHQETPHETETTMLAVSDATKRRAEFRTPESQIMN